MPGVDSYNLYMASQSGVTKLNFKSLSDGVKAAGVISPFIQGGLMAGRTYYFVVTAVNSGGESAESEEVSATLNPPRDPDLEAGFPVKTFHSAGSGAGFTITLVGNIDSDAEMEIVVTSLANGLLYAWKADGSLVPGWPIPGNGWQGHIGLGELSSADPGLEVFSGYVGLPGQLVAYTGSGVPLSGWPLNDVNYVKTPPALADVDGDGLDDIFIDAEDWDLHAYKADGSILHGWPVSLEGGQDVNTPAIADLNGDGDLEIIVASGGYYLSALHHDGTMIKGFPFRFSFGTTFIFPVVGDVDGDGKPEIVVVTNESLDKAAVRIFSADGTVKRMLTPVGLLDYGVRPALADLDGDGVPEIIVQTSSAINIWKGDGSVFPGWPVEGEFSYKSGPVVGDVDGDQQPDIVAIGFDSVFMFNRFGALHPRFPKIIPVNYGVTPAMADIDLDGRNEIIVTGDYWNGNTGFFDKVWVYDLGGTTHGSIQWGQFGGGPRHQGRYMQ